MQLIKKLVLANKGFIAFLFGMLLFRSAIADWYMVPSSSMYPTLLIGDRVLSDRLAYDIKLPFTDIILKHNADPVRGDIVTFTSPENGIRLVKRLIAVPGDIVEMHNEKLIINGIELSYQRIDKDVNWAPDYLGQQLAFNEDLFGINHQILQLPDRYAMRSFGPVQVPTGQYLMLGDNRDNSVDSRSYGFVKRELITGKVTRVLFSLDSENNYLPRLNRTAMGLYDG